MSRIDTLLKLAAVEFDHGRSPFETEWLTKNNVTLNEAYALSESIANIIMGYLASPISVKAALLMLAATE